jgi:hypothetical protein
MSSALSTSFPLFDVVQFAAPPGRNASLPLFEEVMPPNPAKQVAWDGEAWVGVPEYAWNGALWVAVVPSPLKGVLPISMPYVGDGRNGLIFALGLLLAQQVGSLSYCNPALNTPSGTPGYPTGGYPGGAITVTPTQISDLAAHRGAWRAFDNSIADGNVAAGNAASGGDAATASVANPWWQCDFGVDRRVSLTRVGHRNWTPTSNNPTNYKWQGSNDGSTWTDLTAVQAGAQTSGAWFTHAVTDATPYRYVRLQLAGTQFCVVGEVEFWGTLQEAP